jgi:hypothetical protein
LAVAPTRIEDGRLKEDLRQARLLEAAHFDAVRDLRDAKTLRLQLLKDELQPQVQALPGAAELFDLALITGEPPRLWIDLITFVQMDPDPRTFRLLQDRQDNRELLFESSDLGEMAAAVRRHMAHRLIARERQGAAVTLHQPQAGYSIGSLMLAWTSGFAFGALVLMGLAIVFGWIGR